MDYESIKDAVFVRKGESLGAIGENFAVALDDETVYELSPAAYYVWEMLDGKLTVAQVVSVIGKELEISEEELKQPVALLLEKLLEAGLVEKK